MLSSKYPLATALFLIAAACNNAAPEDDTIASAASPLDSAPHVRLLEPPQAAFDACKNLEDGAACKVTFRNHSVEGTCRPGPTDDAPLLCVPPHPVPPPEAIEACAELAAGNDCQVDFEDHQMQGICRKTPDSESILACMPKRMHPPPQALEACKTSNEGADCSVTFAKRTLHGTCLPPPHGTGQLACVPARPHAAHPAPIIIP